MIDIHCHILPDVDDGADSMQAAIMMAAMAADDGVEAIIATPHVTWAGGLVEGDLVAIQTAAGQFRQALSDSRIPLECRTGAEVLCAAHAPTRENKAQFPTLAGTDYVLTEFYFDEKPEKITAFLQQLQALGFRPIVAHPERYTAVQRDKSLPVKWVEQGILLQVNKASAFGLFGARSKKAVEGLLKNRLASFLATDAHNTGNRTTRMAAACDKLADRYGEAYIRALTLDNPRKLLAGEEIR